MLEKDIEKKVCEYARSKGVLAYKFTSPAHRGVADRVVCLPGGAVWFVELKAEGGRLSPLQKVFADEMTRLNQKYVCLWSKEDVDGWIANLGA